MRAYAGRLDRAVDRMLDLAKTAGCHCQTVCEDHPCPPMFCVRRDLTAAYLQLRAAWPERELRPRRPRCRVYLEVLNGADAATWRRCGGSPMVGTGRCFSHRDPERYPIILRDPRPPYSRPRFPHRKAARRG